MSARGRMTEVELVEIGTDEPVTDEGLPARPGGPPRADADADAVPRSRWRRVARAWPVAVVVLLVASGYLVSERREAARAAAVQQSAIFLPDLESPFDEVWAVSGVVGRAQLFGPAQLRLGGPVVGGSLVLVQELAGPSGNAYGDEPSSLGSDVLALDVATGEVRWRVPGTGGESLDCSVQRAADGAEVVVCERQRWHVPLFDVDDGFELIEPETSLELRDPGTGKVVATRDTTGEDILPWGREVLVVETADDGVFLRLESYGGELRWRVPILERALAAEARVTLSGAGERVVVDGARQIVVDRAGTVVLDVADLDRAVPAHGPGPSLLPTSGGRFVLVAAEERSPEEDGPWARSVVVGADGTVVFEVPGVALGAWADDGTVPDALVVWGQDAVEVWQAGVDAPLASRSGPPSMQTLLLDGAMISYDGAELRAVELHGGGERWSVAGTGGRVVATDGDTILLHEYGTPPAFRAVSVRTGEELWQVPVGHRRAEPAVHDGMLFVNRGESIVRFGR